MKNPKYACLGAKWRIVRTKLIALLLASSILSAMAQFSITGPTISSTSSTSSGGGFSLAGNISQPVVSKAAAGSFSVESGSVGIIAVVPNPTGPELTLSLTSPNTIVLRWPHPSAGFHLEEAPVIGADQWTRATAAAVQAGSEWQVVIPAPAGNRFYRLRAE
jgi:hypothetical protein